MLEPFYKLSREAKRGHTKLGDSFAREAEENVFSGEEPSVDLFNKFVDRLITHFCYLFIRWGKGCHQFNH